MIVTLFRAGSTRAARMSTALWPGGSELVRDIPGYISPKGFVADDGERVTIVEFETEEALREWRVHPEHGTAKRHAIESLFAEYKFQICSVVRDRSWVGRTHDTTTTYNAREDGSMRS